MNESTRYYWLSYVAARCTLKENVVTLKIKGSDLSHVKKLGIASFNDRHASLNSIEFIEELKRVFIWRNNKLYHIQGWSVPNFCLRDIVRGYFDSGRGYIITPDVGKSGIVCFYMPSCVVEWIPHIIQRHIELCGSRRRGQIRYNGTKQCNVLLQWMYGDSTTYLRSNFMKYLVMNKWR